MVYTVEVALPATPPAVSSGESATLRLPLSIINDDALQTHAAERPRGRAVLYLFSIEHAEQRWGGGTQLSFFHLNSFEASELESARPASASCLPQVLNVHKISVLECVREV